MAAYAVAAAALCAGAGWVWGQGGEHGSVLAAGSGQELWVVRNLPPDRFEVLHRNDTTPAGELHRLLSARGEGVIGAAAAEQRLYLLYTDRSVQAMRRRAEQQRPEGEALEAEQLPPAPGGGEVTGWEAGRSGPMVLLHRRPGAEQASGQNFRGQAHDPGAPAEQAGDDEHRGDAGATAESEPQATPSAEGGSEAGSAVGRLRLYRLRRDRWEAMELPAEIESAHVRQLVAVDPQRDLPALVSEAGAQRHLRVDRYDGQKWVTERYELRLAGRGQVVAVQRNLYAVQPSAAGGGATLSVYLLRGGRVRPVGELARLESAGPWWAMGMADRVAVVATAGEGRLAWARMSVMDGGEATPLTPLEPTQPPALVMDPLTIAVTAALLIGMAVLFMTVRRDPAAHLPKLPKELRPAGVHRAAAAAIDLAVALGVAMAVFRIGNPVQIFRHWPNPGVELAAAAPALAAIGVHAAHTALTELLSGATLGKALFGCRVVNLRGASPHPWQVLGRGVFKVVELAAPVLLIVPVMSVHRQRLGDLVARTVVVRRAGPSRSPVED